MKIKQLKISSEIIYNGKRFTVVAFRPPNVVLKRLGDNETVEAKFDDLIMHLSQDYGNEIDGKTVEKPEQKSLLTMLPAQISDIVKKRYELIKPLIDFEKLKTDGYMQSSELIEKYPEYFYDEKDISDINETITINRIANQKNVSARSIRRYLSAYRKAESDYDGWGMEVLIPRTFQRIRKDDQILVINDQHNSDKVLDTLTVRLKPEYIQILKEVIEKEYLTTLKPSIANIVESVNTKCSKENLESLSSNTIRKIIERIDKRVKTRYRDGSRAAQKYNDTTRGYTNEEAKYPLHIVAIDHKLLDIDVIDENGFVIGRPWLTLGLDLFSRKIWGIHLSFDDPSSDKVMKTLIHGLFPKEEKEIYRTENGWDIFGVPRIIQLDNGKDFRSEHVRRMVTEVLQSEIRFRPPHTPQYGGAVERVFKTIDTQLIHRLEGTRKSNPKELGEYVPDDEAKLTLSGLREILCRYIIDVYHFSVHKGLPRNANTPAARYIDGIKMAGFPEYISLQDKERIMMEMLPQDKKPYTRDGIRYKNVRYKSPKCSDLINDREIKYTIKYDTDDISHIYVLHPKTSEYIEVPSVEPPADEIKGISRKLYGALRKFAASISERKNQLIPGVKQMQRSKDKLEEVIQKKYSKSRQARKDAAKSGIEIQATLPSNDKEVKKNEQEKRNEKTFQQLLKKTKLD